MWRSRASGSLQTAAGQQKCLLGPWFLDTACKRAIEAILICNAVMEVVWSLSILISWCHCTSEIFDVLVPQS